MTFALSSVRTPSRTYAANTNSESLVLRMDKVWCLVALNSMSRAVAHRSQFRFGACPEVVDHWWHPEGGGCLLRARRQA